MIVHADIVEDFSRSLADLHDMLSVAGDMKDPFYITMVRDAQIFSFLRCSQVLHTLIQNIHDENIDEEELGAPDASVVSLCMLDIIDEEQAQKMIDQLELAEFFSVDRSWCDYENERRFFDGGVNQIGHYYKGMSTLLNEVCSQCTLIEVKEAHEKGH